ncbi:MAG: cytidylate kinase-like family protein [Roseburia sp.]|nr:cytidylate kinase-like family protein [Roseburia sp.]
MNCNYITIEREYGSGGTKIARRLARECQIPCYGEEILEEVAKRKGISVERMQQYEEKATNSFLYTLVMMGRAQAGNSDMLTDEGAIYLEEQTEIQRIAMDGKAIFLGHCASEALKERKGVVKVFIRSGDSEEKHRRIAEDYGIEEKDIAATQKFYDRKRANYYRANTSKNWKDFNNYDIVLDSAALGTDGCVAVLKGLLA